MTNPMHAAVMLARRQMFDSLHGAYPAQAAQCEPN